MVTIRVQGNHPLSQHFAYSGKLPIGEVRVSSVSMGYWYVMLIVHRMDQLAQELLSTQSLHENPSKIELWLYRRNFRVSAKWITEGQKIYHDILLHQYETGSDWFREFNRVIHNSASPTPTFLICSNRGDFVFTTGWRASQFDKFHHEPPGHNLYGKLVSNLAKTLADGEVPTYHFAGLPDLRVDDSLLSHRKNVVLVLGDSIVKYLGAITHGLVLSSSGETAEGLVTKCNSFNIDLGDFEYVVIEVGTNFAKILSGCETRTKLGHSDGFCNE